MRQINDLNFRSKSGFTLLELISVLILMGILAAAIMVGYQRGENEVAIEVNTLKAHLRYAQFRAMSAGSTGWSVWGISFPNNNNYTLTFPAAQATILPGESSVTHTLPSGMTMSGFPANVTFDEWGTPSWSGSLTLTLNTKSQSITITSGTGYIP